MHSSWLRRAARAVACAGALTLLAACGSGSVVSDLDPKRFLTVGDSFMDLGQDGVRYTVNDGSRHWVEELALQYNQTVTPASAGGYAYAQGHARVTAEDPGGAPSVAAQIDALLARTALHSTEDLVLVNGGMHDIVAAVEATGISEATTQAAKDAGKALAEQVRRLVNAGGRHVAVTGVPFLGNSPWGRSISADESTLNQLSIDFNTALLVNIVDLGDTVLYLDAAFFFDLLYDEPGNYLFDNGKDPVCTTPDASTCTPATVAATDYNRWLYADGLHFTPRALQHFGSDRYAENAYYRLSNRW
jgi:phospholipase/lecithinase/hemolysin